MKIKIAEENKNREGRGGKYLEREKYIFDKGGKWENIC